MLCNTPPHRKALTARSSCSVLQHGLAETAYRLRPNQRRHDVPPSQPSFIVAQIFGSQGMTRARSIELPLHPPMPGPVALEDAKYRIDQAIAEIERPRQEIQMAPSEHELIYLGILGL